MYIVSITNNIHLSMNLSQFLCPLQFLVSALGRDEGYTVHYIILNNGILKSNSSIFPRSEWYITQYTPFGVYGLIVNDNNEVNISLMIVKTTRCRPR